MKNIKIWLPVLLTLIIVIFVVGYLSNNKKNSNLNETIINVNYRQTAKDNIDVSTNANETIVKTPDIPKIPITPSNFKIAMIADQGLGNNAKAVLNLIKNEGADMVLNFPYFASIGNHDIKAWTNYQQKLYERLERVEDANCIGDLGVKSTCKYKGITFLLLGAGTKGSGYDDYIKEQLSNTNSIWRICSWHKNQELMQVGYKTDEAGWGPYEECRKEGAIIATGHEHSYSRTVLMDNFENQEIASTSKNLRIEKGRSFAFVSGLGGRGIRDQNDDIASENWWASVYTARQDADYGALFCVFNENQAKNKAYCYFKNINGVIVDEFELVNNIQYSL